MFNKVTEKIIEKNFRYPIESLSANRKKELQFLRENIRSNPEQVELWFDEEIKKIEALKIQDLIKSVLGQ